MQIIARIKAVEKILRHRFEEIDEVAFANQVKVLEAFKQHHIQDYHFNQSSGYGYGDSGRDALEAVFSEVFAGEDALVRSQIVSGTHAIAACLMGLLRSGDTLVSAAGSPYDTLRTVIGWPEKQKGSLVERGVQYLEIALDDHLHPDLSAIQEGLPEDCTMVMVQRSRGYSLRPALDIPDLRALFRAIRRRAPRAVIFVDNCYGEFTDLYEPLEIGADLIAGSLIKNPGGGLVPSGGYIVGRRELVESAAYHLTAPGLGKELGASLINPRLLFQGLFLSPHVTAQAMKTAVLLAYLFAEEGYEAYPQWHESRGDIVQAICMTSEDEVQKFCQIVQSNSPVGSGVRLEYAPLPGYESQIIMAAGTFIQGSSIELSCDAPLRSPYCVYIQGGLSYEHGRYVACKLLEKW